MRAWYKYIFEQGKPEKIFLPMNLSYEYQSKAMGGYNASSHYVSKKIFWDAYFHGRYISWDSFLRTCLSKKDKILSVASGRAANELKLIENGFKLTCSDMEIPLFFKQSKNLFGTYPYIKFNVLTEKPNKKYDAIISIGLICLFNDEQLSIFFDNIENCLKAAGKLILESPGKDNLAFFIFHNIYLRFENNFLYLYRKLRRKRYRLIKSFHAYRRSDEEIINLANKYNFTLRSKRDYDFLTELERSFFISKLFLYFPNIKNLFSIFGRLMPYSRIFEFVKQ